MTSRLPLRFESKVERTDTCWLWMGATNSKGYGCWSVDGVSQLAHRVAYQTLVGPIPEGLTIDHLCRVKVCVNPAHLEPVTMLENIARAAEQDRPANCPYGHEYTAENTYVKVRPNGQINRTCRTCVRAKARAKYREVRAAAGMTRVRRSRFDAALGGSEPLEVAS